MSDTAMYTLAEQYMKENKEQRKDGKESADEKKE